MRIAGLEPVAMDCDRTRHQTQSSAHFQYVKFPVGAIDTLLHHFVQMNAADHQTGRIEVRSTERLKGASVQSKQWHTSNPVFPSGGLTTFSPACYRPESETHGLRDATCPPFDGENS
jgi:hypothetical protein